MSLPNSVLAWPHPLMITAASSLTHTPQTPPRRLGEPVQQSSQAWPPLSSRLRSMMTTTRNSASTAMTTSARARCVSSWIFSPTISRHFVAASGLRTRSWVTTIIKMATTNAKTRTS
ncbi:hypothetical protein C8J57DRAFT_1479618, partial [Mycena rebaudengoi]